MSEDATPRLGLPLLHAGQAQKELDHNEALARLDIAVQPVVTAIGVDTPPASPGEGECWIVGGSPVGAWSGHATAIAGWTAAGWRFVAPRDGMTVRRATDGLAAHYGSGGWVTGVLRANAVMVNGAQVLGAQRPAIDDPDGGAIVDAEARDTLSGVLAALRTHGLIAT